MVYTVNYQHVYKSEILPKWMAEIFYSQCAMFVYDLHVYKLWNINSLIMLMVKYVQVWNRILSKNI